MRLNGRRDPMLWAHRRRQHVFRLRKFVPILVVVTAFGIAVLALRLAAQDHLLFLQARTVLLNWSGREGLALRNILVGGRKQVSETDIEEAVGMPAGTPLLGINLAAVRGRLLALPWVREASVSIRLPDSLVIEMEETVPFALWQQAPGQLTLIDQKGTALGPVARAQFPFLPIVSGRGAPEHAQDLIAMVQGDAALFHRMAGADYVGERRWNVTFDNGIVVKLPEENPELAWRVLGTLEKRDRILERRIAIIDLRLPDRMFVELPSAPLHGSPVSGKEI